MSCVTACIVALGVALSGCSKGGQTRTEKDLSDAATKPKETPALAESVIHPAVHEAHEKVVVPVVTISDKTETMVHVAWSTPPGTAVNDDAPFRVRWTTSEGLAEVPPEMRAKGKDVLGGFDVPVVATKGTPEAFLTGEVEIVVCDAESHSVCLPVKRRVEMSFLVGHEAKPKKETVTVPLPKAK